MISTKRWRKIRVKLKVGVVGATGMVGEVFLKLIEERKFPYSELRLFASDRSVGQKLFVGAREFSVLGLSEGCFDGLDLVFFSSGDDISKQWAPKAARAGAFAVDNSGAFRMDEKTPLVVPEVNASALPPRELPAIIANPNCSTIQLVVALKPLAEKFGLHQVRVASYQAISGAGRAAQNEYLNQLAILNLKPSDLRGGGIDGERWKSLPAAAEQPAHIAFNCIPEIGGFTEDGFCSEERKIRNESRKILNLPHLKISAWTVRIPALNVHSECTWVTLERAASRQEVIAALKEQTGLIVEDAPNKYPLAIRAQGTDPVYVGRIHQDPDDPKTWMLWIVADNLRKGAALNGIQIAEKIFLS